MTIEKRASPTLWAVTILHIIWGINYLTASEGEMNIAALGLSHSFISSYTLNGILYIFFALLSAASLWMHEKKFFGLLLCMPQQYLTTLSAGSSLQCIINSAYADGVIRSRIFIASDQSIYIAMDLAHALALNSIYNYDKVATFWQRVDNLFIKKQAT